MYTCRGGYNRYNKNNVFQFIAIRTVLFLDLHSKEQIYIWFIRNNKRVIPVYGVRRIYIFKRKARERSYPWNAADINWNFGL